MSAPHVLVVHGSGNGSTAEIAKRTAQALRIQGLTADVRAAASVADIDPYGAVIVGGALYCGRRQRGAIRFCHRHRKALSRRAGDVAAQLAREPTPQRARTGKG